MRYHIKHRSRTILCVAFFAIIFGQNYKKSHTGSQDSFIYDYDIIFFGRTSAVWSECTYKLLPRSHRATSRSLMWLSHDKIYDVFFSFFCTRNRKSLIELWLYVCSSNHNGQIVSEKWFHIFKTLQSWLNVTILIIITVQGTIEVQVHTTYLLSLHTIYTGIIYLYLLNHRGRMTIRESLIHWWWWWWWWWYW